jgi:hypothetical protein
MLATQGSFSCMGRLCERPGCSQPAEVIYGIDADHLTVWIEPFDGTVGYRAGVLCRRHADAMVVPLGWMLDDRREPTPRLFRPKETPAAVTTKTPASPRRPRHRAARDETGQLELDTDDLDDDDADPAAEWKPVFDQTDDLDGLLTARSPLLSRAFGKRGSPRG